MAPQILIHNRSKLEVIEEVARFFESHYPDYYQFCLDEIKKLRSVSRTGYTDPQGRYTHVSMKVPTLLFMAVQHILPEFGKDSDDIALLTKTLKQLDAHIPLRPGHSLFIDKELYKSLHLKGDPDDRPPHATREGPGSEEGCGQGGQEDVADSGSDRRRDRQTASLEGAECPK